MLIDLAGSETVHENTTAQSTREGMAIVKSLFHLRNCIHALSSNKRPDFRSAKLTRLLEPSMRNGCVVLICNMPLVITNARQIVDCLEFGRQAQHVSLTPTQQTVADGDSEFHRLKELMEGRVQQAQAEARAAAQSEVAQLREDYERRLDELQANVIS